MPWRARASPTGISPAQMLIGDGLMTGASGDQGAVEIDPEAPVELPIRDQAIAGELRADALADALGQEVPVGDQRGEE